jgi:RNA polymerase sigma-70 factor (ECF subfamily)
MVKYDELSDLQLASLLGESDHRAYTEIYKRYWAVLFRHSRRMLQDDEAAKDVVQDIFIMLWAKGSVVVLNTSLSAFLYSAVRNKVFDLIDRNKVKGNYLASLEKFIDSGEFTTDNQVLEKEIAAIIEKEIAFLPAKMREVFELSRKSNLSYKEIAVKMDITDHTVKKQMSNALKILRFKFDSLFSIIIIFF